MSKFLNETCKNNFDTIIDMSKAIRRFFEQIVFSMLCKKSC